MSTRNKTLTLSSEEYMRFERSLLTLSEPVILSKILDRVVWQDMENAAAFLPKSCVDLLILDPPYNMSKSFNSNAFRKQSISSYSARLNTWIEALLPTLKASATVYICGDWFSSASIYEVASRHFKIRNRITWEREKGRGALHNWKNCSEDIWFCTMSDDFYFNADAVKLKRKVLAPYREANKSPKDWTQSEDGNVRLTYSSNLWTDITIPFWSMAENTEHPTQKPEKMLAKLLLASSKPGDVIFDPFLGSGTSAVVASKLSRRFIAIEVDKKYACLAQKRLALAKENYDIQGYSNGIFWERNSLVAQKKQYFPKSKA